MRVPIWVVLLVVATAGCEDANETKYKRAMREIDRAHHELSEGLREENLSKAAAIHKPLAEAAGRIATEAARPEVVGFIDAEDFRNYAKALHDDAAELQATLTAGEFEQAMNVQFVRVHSDCELCHSQYKTDDDD